MLAVPGRDDRVGRPVSDGEYVAGRLRNRATHPVTPTAGLVRSPFPAPVFHDRAIPWSGDLHPSFRPAARLAASPPAR